MGPCDSLEIEPEVQSWMINWVKISCPVVTSTMSAMPMAVTMTVTMLAMIMTVVVLVIMNVMAVPNTVTVMIVLVMC